MTIPIWLLVLLALPLMIGLVAVLVVVFFIVQLFRGKVGLSMLG